MSERKFHCNLLITGIKEIGKSMSAMLYLPFENGTVSKKKSCQVNLCGVFLFKKILIKCGNHCSFKSNGVQPECPVNYSEAKHSAFPSSHFFPSPHSLPTLTQEIEHPVPLTAN